MQRLTPYLVHLISTMIAWTLSHSALANPLVNTTESANLVGSNSSSVVNGSTLAFQPGNTQSNTVSMGIRMPLTSDDDISCGKDKGRLKAFICSEINDPNNSTVIYSNTSDFNAIKDKLGCENTPATELKTNKPGYDQWITSVSIWVWESVEMYVLLEGSIKVNPKAKREILGTAATTSAITMAAIYGTGATLAESGKKIPEKWVELIEGLTKLKASLCIGGWALGIAGGVAGKKELVLSGLLMNVISNTFRETGEGALITLPLILDKEYAAIALSLIPMAIIGATTMGFTPKATNPCIRGLAWFVVASLGAGLFSGAWHEFEEVAGESSTVWDVGKHITVGDDYEILSHKKLPMSLIAPFGYRPNPTIITVTSGLAFFTFVSLASLYRFIHRVKTTGSGQISSNEATTEF